MIKLQSLCVKEIMWPSRVPAGKWAQVVGIYLRGAIVSNIYLKKGMIIRGNTVNFDHNFFNVCFCFVSFSLLFLSLFPLFRWPKPLAFSWWERPGNEGLVAAALLSPQYWWAQPDAAIIAIIGKNWSGILTVLRTFMSSSEIFFKSFHIC